VSIGGGVLSMRKLRRTTLGAALASSRSSHNNIIVSLSFRAADLRKMGLFGWADSYLQLLRLKDDVWSELGATSVVSGEKNPVWETINIRLSKMRGTPNAAEGEGATTPGATAASASASASSSSPASPPAASDSLQSSGGVDYPLVVKCWHWKKRGDAELMGLFETTLTELQARAAALLEAAPQIAPATAGGDAKPLPPSAFADGTPLAQHHAFHLVEPAPATSSGSSSRRNDAPRHAGLVYVTAAALSIRDPNKRKSKSQRRKTLNASDTRDVDRSMMSTEPSRSRMPW
jgi:hypothetical protein